jgi:hypothetical protein
MKEMRESIRDAGLQRQVSGQTLAELHEIYDEVVVHKALELRCECESMLEMLQKEPCSCSFAAGWGSEFRHGISNMKRRL